MAARSYNGRNIYTPNIDSAAGDVALAGSGYIESNSTFGWYIIRNAANTSAEFDSAVTRTGRLTLKLSTTDATGRLTARQAIGGGTLLAADIPLTIPVKPLRQYTLNVYVKTNNVAGGTMGVALYNPQLVRTYTTGTSISGTNDWTLKTVTFTTKVSDIYLLLDMANATAGNVSDMWIDVNSIELLEVLPARTTANSRTTATNRVAVRDMGTALRFSAGRVEANALDLSIGQPCTVAIWLTPAQLQQYAVLFANLKDASNKLYIGIRNTSNKIEGSWHNGASYLSGFRTNTLTGLSPVFFVLVYDGSTSFPYINGVYSSSGSSNIGTGGVVGKLSIGSLDGALGSPFKGIIDEPRIWNRALTAQEIKDLYLNNIVPQDGLVAEYLFDEATGTTAIDTSGNGNDGTITGATYTTDVPLKLRTSI